MRVGATLLLLLLTGCWPCRTPDVCFPEDYLEGEFVERCGGSDVDISCWWEQFQDAQLTALIARGLHCNHDLRIAQEKVLEARAVYREQFGILLPQVDGGVSYTRVRNSETLTESPFLGGRFVNFFSAGFDMNWEIDIFGKNIDYAAAACLEVGASIEQARSVKVLVASEVASTYVTARLLQERIKIAKQHIHNEQELLDVVSERYRAGLTNELDVTNARGLLEGRLADLPALEADLQATVYALAVLVGQTPESLAPSFCESYPIPCADGKIPLGLPSALLCRRPDVREAEKAMRAAGVRVRAARKEFFPTLNLFSSYGYLTGFFTSWFKPGSRAMTLMPSLTLPLFHGGRILAYVDAQTALQRQAVLAFERSVLVALKEVESALIGYVNEAERMVALDRQVKAYTQSRELSKTLYLDGIVDFLNVFEAERSLFVTQNELAISKARWMTQLIATYKALGGGWECCGMP